jgi:hypothetical protein
MSIFDIDSLEICDWVTVRCAENFLQDGLLLNRRGRIFSSASSPVLIFWRCSCFRLETANQLPADLFTKPHMAAG